MKKKLTVSVAGALAFLFMALTANAYVSDNFESPGQTAGSPPVGWSVDSGVIVSNGGAIKHDAASLYIPILTTVSNAAGAASSKVWTDFYTIPRPFVSDSGTAPTVDSNATAQFFVNPNGQWVTISGNGSGGLLTNICTTALVDGMTYPTVSQYSTLYHVSVLHDYTASNWSLFVNDVPIATNLNFIASDVPAHQWFQVQNLGGNSTNVCWLDDFLVTNRIVASGGGANALTNPVPGTTIPLAVALSYFETLGDPRPAATNFGVASALGANAVRLQFHPQPNQRYVLVGGASPTLSMSTISTTLVDAAGTSNYVVDAGALARGSNYFYKVLTVSQVDNSVAVTNDETYAWYKQDRASLNRWYYSGVPVTYQGSSNNSLASLAGQQLAMGLHADLSGNGPDLMTIGNNIYYLHLSGSWALLSGATLPEDMLLTPGTGVAIKRQSGAASLNYSVLAGTWTNTIGNVALLAGWNSQSWPYDTSATEAKCGFPGISGDMFSVMRGGSPKLAKRYASGWKTFSGNALSASDWPQAGEGFMYYSVAGGSWAPIR